MRKLAVATLLSVVSFAAHAAWQDGEVSMIRIDADPAWATGKEINKSVRVNDSFAQSDAILLGKSAQPGPVGWLSYQTNSRNFKYEGAMDALRNSNATFKDAEFSSEGRSTFKASTAWGEVEVTKFKVVLKGMNRECATWREMQSGNSVLITGFICAAQDQALPDAEVAAALAAIKKKG